MEILNESYTIITLMGQVIFILIVIGLILVIR